MNKFNKLVLMIAAVAIPTIAGIGGTVSYAQSTTSTVASKSSFATVSFRAENLSKVPGVVASWVNRNTAESGTFSMTLGGRTYILVSRGWQAGSRGVKVEQVRRVRTSAIQVNYYNIDPAPGQIDSHVMAKRFVLISIPGTYKTVHFVKVSK